MELCVKAGLQGVEWGGDSHVPHGDLKQAALVARQCADHGLEIPSYGSYYRAGLPHDGKNPTAKAVVDSALELGTSIIRIWVGNKSPDRTSPEETTAILKAIEVICAEAAQANLLVAAEYHAWTLTETIESVEALFAQISAPNFRTFWQPNPLRTEPYHTESLQRVLPHLLHLHVYHWSETLERFPLAEAAKQWKQWLKMANLPGTTRFALLEFFKGDSVEQFQQDAQCLNDMLTQLEL